MVKYTLTEVWNIWAFLTSTGPGGPFGTPISWHPTIVGETVVPPTIRTGKFNLGELMEVLLFRGVVPSLYVQLTHPGVRKTRAPLSATSVTITFKAGFWHSCVVPLLAAKTHP